MLHMKKIQLIIWTLVALTTDTISAAPYSWFHGGIVTYHPDKIIGPTPSAVCPQVERYVKMYWDNYFSTQYQSSSRVEGLTEQHAYCVVELTGQGAKRTERHSMNREGNSCTSGAYSFRSAQCTEASLQGPPSSGCSATTGNQTKMATGNPINFTNGNKYQEEVDFESNTTPLRFARSYNSMDKKWRHSYSASLDIFSNNNATLFLANGKEIPYNSYWTPAQPLTLDSGILQRANGGWIYINPDNHQQFFDSMGKYTGGIAPDGVTYKIEYSLDRTTVTSRGQSISFTSRSDGQVMQLFTPTQTFNYQYDGNKLIGVSKSAAGQSSSRQYHYEDSRDTDLLTGITDELGVRYASWSYDDKGRAISSEHANGAERTSINYNADGSSTITNALGKKTIYRFQAIMGHKRITAIEGEPSANCPNSNSTFTYNSKGLVSSKVDNKGNITTYKYDSNGREESRTEAAGTPKARTIITYWDTKLALPSQSSDSKRVTQYRYDAQGRIVNIKQSSN